MGDFEDERGIDVFVEEDATYGAALFVDNGVVDLGCDCCGMAGDVGEGIVAMVGAAALML